MVLRFLNIAVDRFSGGGSLFEALVAADGGKWKAKLSSRALKGGNSDSIPPNPRQKLPSAYGSEAALSKLVSGFKAGLTAFFSNYDVLLGPVSPQAARSHGDTPQGYEFWNELSAHNISGFPAAVVPAACNSDGLPIGVQIVSAPGRDDVALAVAKAVQSRMGHLPIPKV